MSDNLLGRFHIRRAAPCDVDACNRIARQHPNELAFVRRNSLLEGVARRSLHVAVLDGEVVGFVLFRRRLDGWQTIYDLAVDRSASGIGVGRNLLYSVPAPIRLKCPVDNVKANRFYAGAGMALVEVETGRKRALNVWEMRVLCIFCAGSNRSFTELARQSGMAYGIRHDYKPYNFPFMIDVDFKRFKELPLSDWPHEWDKYMAVIRRCKPVQAMCVDYFDPSQRQELYRQIRDLHLAGVMRIKVCPKFDGAVAHIPSWCIVAVSIPSQYEGFIPPFHELRGRSLHLLGGTPGDQREYITRFNGVGAKVVSIDGSSHESAAKKGTHYEGGKWRNYGDPADYAQTIIHSGRNIVSELNVASQYAQLPLFEN